MAALNLNKIPLADVLGVSRPTFSDWLDGKEPKAANAQRLIRLGQLLMNATVTAADSIRPRFVRESLNDGEPSLLEMLKADTLDEARVAKVLARAKELEADAERTQVAREDRLRAHGFEESLPTEVHRIVAVPAASTKDPAWAKKKDELESVVETFWQQFKPGIECVGVDVIPTSQPTLAAMDPYQRFDAG